MALATVPCQMMVPFGCQAMDSLPFDAPFGRQVTDPCIFERRDSFSFDNQTPFDRQVTEMMPFSRQTTADNSPVSPNCPNDKPMVTLLTMIPMSPVQAPAAPLQASEQGSPQGRTRPTRLLRKLFKGQFSKTRLCVAFEKGQCDKGDACTFAHDVSQLLPAPDLHKTSCCKKFMEGTCKRSKEECHFAHGIDDLRVTSAQVQAPRMGSKMSLCTMSPVMSRQVTPCDTPMNTPSRNMIDFPNAVNEFQQGANIQAAPALPYFNGFNAESPVSCRPLSDQKELPVDANQMQKAMGFLELLNNIRTLNPRELENMLNNATPACYED